MLHRNIALAAALVATSAPAFAQNAPAPGGTAAPPAREGNIWDGKKHQPTQADIDQALGISGPSSAERRQVEEGVQKLLQQTDELDRQMEQQDRDYGGSAGPKPGGR